MLEDALIKSQEESTEAVKDFRTVLLRSTEYLSHREQERAAERRKAEQA